MRLTKIVAPVLFAGVGMFGLVWANTTGAQTTTPDNPQTAGQVQPAPERIEHPVVYPSETETDRPASPDRIEHPVVYPDEGDDAEPARIEHPVVGAPKAGSPTESAQPAPADGVTDPDFDAAEPETPGEPASPTPQHAEAPAQASPAAVALAALLETGVGGDTDDPDAAGLITFYNARGSEPLWIGETGVSASGQALIDEMRNASDWALDPGAFDIPEVAAASQSSIPLNPETRAALELKIAKAILTYANHARGGRITEPKEQLSSYLDRQPQLKNPAVVLDEIAAASDPAAALRAQHPQHPQFEKLRQKYLALQTATASVEVIRIPPGPLLREGTTHPQVALLRKRLEIEPGAPHEDSPFSEDLFDETVATAVKAFQEENGLAADGLVGNGTRRALNDIAVPDPRKLLANMEQWRWMPDDLGETHVWVNIPEFMVRVVKNGEIIHAERIIAGQVDKQTPVFSDEMETLYFHPRWHVPQSIKVNELYPSLARGGSYFHRQGLRIAYNGRHIDPYSVDWTRADIRRYHIYQPPGRGNVLGVVKFTFPNKHQVYLHDTPTKHLFDAKSRTFSHGCMRVRNPLRLAELIVEAANGWDLKRVDAIVNGPVEEHPVTLDRKIPVHITYFTAWVDEDGNEHAVPDIYGHEEKISLALEGRFDQIAVGPDHLAPVKFKPRQDYYYNGPNPFGVFINNIFGGF